MPDRFVKVGGSNLFSGATLEEAWETYNYGTANVGASNTLKFSGLSGGVFTIDRSSGATTAIPNGTAGNPTTITDNADGQVTFLHGGSGYSGMVNFNGGSPAKQYISMIATSPSSIKFDMANQNFGAGLVMGDGTPHHLTFQNLEITRTKASGIIGGGYSAHLTFDGLYIHDLGSASINQIPQDHGIYAHGPYLIIKNCRIERIWGQGIQIYSSSAPPQVGQKVFNNRVSECGFGDADENGQGIDITNGIGVEVYNNVVWGNSGHGLGLLRTEGAKVYHNLFHQNGRSGMRLGGDTGTCSGTLITNNISIGNADYPILVNSNCPGTIISFNVCDAAVQDLASSSISNHTSTGVAIEEWVDPANRDYRLKAGAKSIGVVTTNETEPVGVTEDIVGTTRPLDTYVDIGPYEFVGEAMDSQVDYLSLTMIDSDESLTDTLITSEFPTSGSNRHIDIFVGIASSVSTDVISVSRGGETYARQRADDNPTGSFWQQGEFWMSITEPSLGPAAMTMVLSLSRVNWGFSAVAIKNCEQANRLRGGAVILNPDGDGVVANLIVSSAVGDLVVSGIVGNSGTPPSAISGDGTLRGSWVSGANVGWGVTATATGAASVTLGFNGNPFRFVHYVAIHPPESSTVPDPPAALLVTNYSPTSQILSFAEPSNGGAPVTGYKIEQESPAGGGWSTIIADTESTATSYQINGLTSLTQYNYRVSAINSIGMSDPSSAASATTTQVGNNTQLAFQTWNNYYMPSLPIASAMDQAGQQQIQHQPRSPLYILDTYPILIVPSAQYTQRGYTTAMGGVSVVDADGDLDTIRVEASAGECWVTLSGCTVILGSLGTNDFTIQGTQANLLAAIASLSYTGTVKGEQAIILTATDALGHQDVKSFTVHVLNNAPTITSNGGGASASLNVEEGQTAVTTVVSNDLDPSDTLVYSIVGGEDAAKFSIDSETGALTFIEAPDHDNPTDVDMNNVYLVVVQASDGEAVDIQVLSVTVTIVPVPVSRSLSANTEWRYEMKSPSIVASMEWGTIVPALSIQVPMELALALGRVALVPTEWRGLHVLERSASHEWIMNLGVERAVPTAWLTTAFSPRTAFADYWGPVTVSRLVRMESRGQIASITQPRTAGYEWVLGVSRESGLIPHWHGLSVSLQAFPLLESACGLIRSPSLPVEWVVALEQGKSAISEFLQSPAVLSVLPHEGLGLVRSPRELMDETRRWLAAPHVVTGEWTIAHQAGEALPFESLRATTVGGLIPYEDWGMHGRFFVIPFEILRQI